MPIEQPVGAVNGLLVGGRVDYAAVAGLRGRRERALPRRRIFPINRVGIDIVGGYREDAIAKGRAARPPDPPVDTNLIAPSNGRKLPYLRESPVKQSAVLSDRVVARDGLAYLIGAGGDVRVACVDQRSP